MEEVKKKRGRKPKEVIKQDELQNPPVKSEASQPLDPIKIIFDFVNSLLSSSFRF